MRKLGIAIAIVVALAVLYLVAWPEARGPIAALPVAGGAHGDQTGD